MSINDALKVLGDRLGVYGEVKLVKEKRVVEKGWSVTFRYNRGFVGTDHLKLHTKPGRFN